MTKYKLLKFGAPWCGMCRVVDKNLDNFNACDVIRYDASDDANEKIVGKYGIRNLPTLILIDEEGGEIKRWSGVVANKEIEDTIKEHG